MFQRPGGHDRRHGTAAHTITIYVWQKIKDYLTKAGTVIFIASVIMWGILNFGPHGYVTDISESFGSLIGKTIVPVFAPIGLGYWQIIVKAQLFYMAVPCTLRVYAFK